MSDGSRARVVLASKYPIVGLCDTSLVVPPLGAQVVQSVSPAGDGFSLFLIFSFITSSAGKVICWT